MTTITFSGKVSTLIDYVALLNRKNMSITINYAALHLETLEVILAMHEKKHLELIDSPEAQHQKIQTLQSTIEQVKRAISLKEAAIRN